MGTYKRRSKRKYYEQNREQLLKNRKKYYKENKEKEIAAVKARREYIKWRADAWNREMAQLKADVDGEDIGEVNSW